MRAEQMLEIKNLSFSFNKTPVLSDINVTIKNRTAVCLIGMNGAGKTTLLNCIIGNHKITEGEIIYGKHRLNSLDPASIMKKGIVLIPEGRQLFHHLSVMDNLLLGAYLNQDNEKTNFLKEEMLEFFPILASRKKQLAGSLSGGEQQMLAIARGLMSDPDFLILDEPTLGLSPFMVGKVFEIIDKLKEKKTIFLVEQNAYLTLAHCDLAYIIENGKIVLQGKAKSLLANKRVKESYLGI